MRAFCLFSVLWALSASAQNPACGPCATGAQCIAGSCQFPCAQDTECHAGNVCIGAGEVQGHCEPRLPLQRPGTPATIRRADATHAERFKVVSPVPPGFHLAREPSGEAIARGTIAFACSYLPMAIVGLVTSTPVMAIPVAGPILAHRAETGFLNVLLISGLAIDVSLQVFGLFMATLGFAIPSKWLERDAPTSRF